MKKTDFVSYHCLFDSGLHIKLHTHISLQNIFAVAYIAMGDNDF